MKDKRLRSLGRRSRLKGEVFHPNKMGFLFTIDEGNPVLEWRNCEKKYCKKLALPW